MLKCSPKLRGSEGPCNIGETDPFYQCLFPLTIPDQPHNIQTAVCIFISPSM